MNRAFVLRALLAAALCLATTPAQVAVELPGLDAAQPTIGFGERFELRAELPADFDDAAWLPVDVERLAQRELGGGRVQRVYAARCYRAGDVALPDDAATTLRVRSSLPDPPGPLEWPADGYERARAASWSWWSSALLAVSLAALLLWSRARRRRVAVVDELTAAPPRYDAAAALRALALPEDDERAPPFYGEVKAIVRRHCSAHLSLPADVRTSEELLSALPRGRDELQPCLRSCDAVLFGRARSDRDRHDRARQDALRFVERTERAS